MGGRVRWPYRGVASGLTHFEPGTRSFTVARVLIQYVNTDHRHRERFFAIPLLPVAHRAFGSVPANSSTSTRPHDRYKFSAAASALELVHVPRIVLHSISSASSLHPHVRIQCGCEYDLVCPGAEIAPNDGRLGHFSGPKSRGRSGIADWSLSGSAALFDLVE